MVQVYKVGIPVGTDAIQSILPEPLGMRYPMGEVMMGIHGPLFAFSSATAAREFATYCKHALNKDTQVWIGQAEVIADDTAFLDEAKKIPLMALAYPEDPSVVAKYWQDTLLHKVIDTVLPKAVLWRGTVLCEWLRLERQETVGY